MTCDGTDVITKSIEVPIDVNISDWFCFSGMGAYIYGSKSTFNGMKATDKVIKWSAIVHKGSEFAL
jgi:diaminopimelate decarboxylase